MLDYKKTLDNFISYLSSEKSLSRNTISAYAADVLKFIGFAEKSKMPLENFTHQDITDFLWKMKTERLKPRTICRLSVSLKQFYKFLSLEDLIESNPALHLKASQISEKLPVTLNVEEVNLLLNSMSGGGEIDIRNKAMLELMYAAGLRVSELVNLKFSNMNLEDCFLRVTGKGSRERLIPFSGKAKNFISIYLRKRKPALSKDDNIFISRLGRKLSRVEFWRQLKSIAKDAGIAKNITPHTLRHSFASHLLWGGADIRFIQELLGHASIATTQIYAHLDKTKIMGDYKKYHPRDRLGKFYESSEGKTNVKRV